MVRQEGGGGQEGGGAGGWGQEGGGQEGGGRRGGGQEGGGRRGGGGLKAFYKQWYGLHSPNPC